MKTLFGKIKGESGQALVIVAFSLVALFGITAFSVDMGMAYNAKAELQAAADATALAAAQELRNPANIESTVIKYAGLNGVDENHVTYQTPYVDKGGVSNSNQIEVTCTRTFEYLFAKFLGFDSKVIEARAVAEARLVWGQQTLPFMNIDDSYAPGSTIVLWEQTGTGDYEQLLNNNNHPEYEFTYDGNNKKTAIDCMLNGLGDGFLDIRNGLNASIDDEVADLCTLWKEGEFIYALSLKTIPTDPADQLNYINAQSIKEGGKVTGASIPLTEIVLVKCQITNVKLSPISANDRGITLVVDPYFEPPTLAELLASGEDIPGFVNYDVRYRLVE